MFFVGKIIGGLNAKKRLQSGGGENPVQTRTTIAERIASAFKPKEGNEGNSNITDKELDKIAAEEYKKYWGNQPGGVAGVV
jgi:hypothetical protein